MARLNPASDRGDPLLHSLKRRGLVASHINRKAHVSRDFAERVLRRIRRQDADGIDKIVTVGLKAKPLLWRLMIRSAVPITASCR
jgi:hypothetical protein